MSQTKYDVASVLVSDTHVTLVTTTGGLHPIPHNGDIDAALLASDVIDAKMAGETSIEVDLLDYNNTTSQTQKLVDDVNQGDPEGILTVIEHKGRKIKGMFYPEAPVVGVKDGDKVTPLEGLDKLSDHIEDATESGSPGVANLLKRIKPVVTERLHTAEDLLNFLEQTEMPIRDDGCIIAYRRMNRSTTVPGSYTDVHSGRVVQRVGSIVEMDAVDVDPDRYNACSNGLHVASLNYLASFTGNAIVMVLIKPEDFIAVPANEPIKARVCRYQIVGEVDTSTFLRMVRREHSEEPGFVKLLQTVLNNQQPSAHELIKVGRNGQNTVTPLDSVDEDPIESKATAKSMKAKIRKKLDKNPSKSVEELQTKVRTKRKTLAEQCQALYAAWEKQKTPATLRSLVNFKVEKKKGWKALGLTKEQEDKVNRANK